MQTHLIKIVPDPEPSSEEENWTDWATRNVKENGWKAAGAALIAAPIIPAGIGAVAVGAGLVSGVQNGIAWLRRTDSIQKIELSTAISLHDGQNKPLQVDQVYAVHPDETRPNLVIVASEFHNVIVGEQIADLVNFIRSSVRANSIKIDVESERQGSASGGFLSRFSFKAEASSRKHHSVDLEYDDPSIVPSSAKLFWLHLFPEVIAAFQGAQRGSVRRSVSIDTTFGVSAALAKHAGIDTSWLGRQRFEVAAKFL